MADRIKITILGDGVIKSLTDEIGPENHQSAEGFFELLRRLTGGKSTIEQRGDHAHTHGEHEQHHHHHN